MTRVYLHTFGCKTNQYDTALVRQALEVVGAEVVENAIDADAFVVNTCTVTHVSEAKMRGLVRRISRANPAGRTVLMGCAAALDDGQLAALPGVVDVVGGADPARVLGALGLSAEPAKMILRRFERNARAWLKIQDGCDEHCTFCATTLARGGNRSRAEIEILAEAEALAASHAEIVLTGVHIGTYGQDLRDGSSLGHLVERLVTRVPRVRFRLSSVEATEMDDRIVELMAGAPARLAPHLHAPLQSGSDLVLKRMGRHWYTPRAYRERVEWIAGRLGAFGLGADVMVGFPGETEQDHERTMALIHALPFTYLHVFPYSERPGVPARRIGAPTAPDDMRRRAAALRALAAAKRASYSASRSGGRADIVVLRQSDDGGEGLTEDYLPVSLRSAGIPPRRVAATLRLTVEGELEAYPDD